MPKTDAQSPDFETMAGQCACSSFRRASRAVTQHFDEILEPSGLRSTQFVILVSVGANQPTSVSRLARELVMDASTVTRNLKPLEAQGLVKKTSEGTRRRLSLTLTAKGRKAVAESQPLWELAQRSFLAGLEDSQWDALRGDLSRAVDAARAALGRR